jgi:hypothetical protein
MFMVAKLPTFRREIAEDIDRNVESKSSRKKGFKERQICCEIVNGQTYLSPSLKGSKSVPQTDIIDEYEPIGMFRGLI